MKTVLHLSPYSAVPPQYGGPIRIYNLCYQLSCHYQVMHFAQQPRREDINWRFSPVIKQITPTYTEYSSRNPLSIFSYGIISKLFKLPHIWLSEVLQVSAPRWLYEQLKNAVIINVEHPWQFSWVYQQVKTKKPVVLTAHNIEAALFFGEEIAALSPKAKYLAQELERRERFAMRHATCVFTMCAEDSVTLAKRYNIPPEKCIVIPNGVDCKAFVPASPSQREHRKQELGLTGKCSIVFAGSTHGPNLEAVQQIINWAESWPGENVHFLVIGSVGRAFPHVQHPNITFTGFVEDTRPFFEAADIAINPIMSGSGTNIKQIEYMAMGLPSVTTPTGTRGIPMIDEKHGYIRKLDDFTAQLKWLVERPELRIQVGVNARNFVENAFDWSVISSKMVKVYEELENTDHYI